MLQIKKIPLLFTLILLSVICKAQVSYFGSEVSSNGKLDSLKNTTTLFTFQYNDYKELEKFDEAIKKVWTITPYKIIKPNELANYDANSSSYSLFYLDAYSEAVDTTTKVNIVYTLKLITPSKKPKQKEESVLATINLYSDVYTNMIVKEMGGKLSARRGPKSNILSVLYNNSTLYNWSPGFLAGYLKQVNDGLISGKSRYLDFQFYNKVRLPQLVNETLYVPEYIRRLFSENKKAGADKIYNVETAPEMYNYKLKFPLYAELDSLILNKEKPVKYLVYTQRSNDKIISIYDSKDNQIIYQKFIPQSISFEMSDLIDIKKLIKSIQ
ncbi:hypothetical protein [Pedobacter jamesrossensis]|uniref:DUF4136 domain-containing protein n=1 Tax=Pedobacter jamesrossensis TaxID=1908238 RepID=A0ABV8NHY6_9SPHI